MLRIEREKAQQIATEMQETLKRQQEESKKALQQKTAQQEETQRVKKQVLAEQSNTKVKSITKPAYTKLYNLKFLSIKMRESAL